MKFVIDMPLSPALAKWLAERGHEATHVSHLNMARSSDVAILERARADRAVVLTADVDYPRLMPLAQADSPGSFSSAEEITARRKPGSAFPALWRFFPPKGSLARSS